MQNLTSIFVITFLIFVSCKGKTNSIKEQSDSFAIKKTFAKEIPVYKEGPSKGDTIYLFKLIRKDAVELGLDFIEDGFDSLQIRIFLGHSMAIKRNVVVLKNSGGKWSGQLITFSYGNDNDGTEFIEKKDIKEVHPKSGWNVLIKGIKDFQITTLPNGEDINGYNSCGGMDGIDYFFEIATPGKYRFICYCSPEENVTEFWQVKNMLEFSTLLEREFDFTYTK